MVRAHPRPFGHPGRAPGQAEVQVFAVVHKVILGFPVGPVVEVVPPAVAFLFVNVLERLHGRALPRVFRGDPSRQRPWATTGGGGGLSSALGCGGPGPDDARMDAGPGRPVDNEAFFGQQEGPLSLHVSCRCSRCTAMKCNAEGLGWGQRETSAMTQAWRATRNLEGGRRMRSARRELSLTRGAPWLLTKAFLFWDFQVCSGMVFLTEEPRTPHGKFPPSRASELLFPRIPQEGSPCHLPAG